MPSLILHAGLHKTGTTAIQAFAAKNRAAFKSQGILYPDYSPFLSKKYDAHHDFAHTIAGQGKRLDFHQTRRLAQNWARTADQESLKVFLSSESISRHIDPKTTGNWQDKRRAYLKNLADVLSDFKITAVVVLRRQDNYVKSLFQEHVMKNAPAGRRPFAVFLKNFEKNNLQKRFYQNLVLFEEIFHDIKVLVYEDLIKDAQLCNNFFSEISINTMDMPQVGVVRKSLTAPETMLKIFLNHAIESKKQNRYVLEHMRSPEVQSLLSRYFPGKNYDLWENFKARKDFLACFDEENEKIQKRYFPRRKDQLFSSLLKDNTNARIPDLPESFKAELGLKGFLPKNSFYGTAALKNTNIDKFFNLLKQLARRVVSAIKK
jgi:hypothetical protein